MRSVAGGTGVRNSSRYSGRSSRMSTSPPADPIWMLWPAIVESLTDWDGCPASLSLATVDVDVAGAADLDVIAADAGVGHHLLGRWLLRFARSGGGWAAR